MVIGVGIDILQIKRIKNGYEKFGNNFLKKLFTEKEIDYCEIYKTKFESYAGKFSVKEACMKALGSGIKQGVWFKDIEVLNHESQQPYVTFYNKALEIYNNLGCPKINVSISHSETTSVAIVILDKQE